jgi:hypothetical protein
MHWGRIQENWKNPRPPQGGGASLVEPELLPGGYRGYYFSARRRIVEVKVRRGWLSNKINETDEWK